MTSTHSLLRTLVVLAGASLASLSLAQFSFPSFTAANVGSGADQITLNGDASLSGTGLQLTHGGDGYASGTAFYNTKQSVSDDFSTVFRYNLPGGDGIAFLFNNNAAGAGLYSPDYYGGYMGYIGSTRTLAVEFDNFGNGGDDTIGVAVRRGDAPAFGSEIAGRGAGVSGEHDVKITHTTDGTLSVYLDDFTTPFLTVANLSLSDFSDTSGLTYVGFSAGEASVEGDQTITSWRSPAAVPEPSAFAALGLGFGALVSRRRRKG